MTSNRKLKALMDSGYWNLSALLKNTPNVAEVEKTDAYKDALADVRLSGPPKDPLRVVKMNDGYHRLADRPSTIGALARRNANKQYPKTILRSNDVVVVVVEAESPGVSINSSSRDGEIRPIPTQDAPAVAEPDRPTVEVPIDELIEYPRNPQLFSQYLDVAAINMLVADIAENGVRIPLAVANDGKTVVDGYRRLRAARRARRPSVPVIVHTGLDPTDHNAITKFVFDAFWESREEGTLEMDMLLDRCWAKTEKTKRRAGNALHAAGMNFVAAVDALAKHDPAAASEYVYGALIPGVEAAVERGRRELEAEDKP